MYQIFDRNKCTCIRFKDAHNVVLVSAAKTKNKKTVSLRDSIQATVLNITLVVREDPNCQAARNTTVDRNLVEPKYIETLTALIDTAFHTSNTSLLQERYIAVSPMWLIYNQIS